MGREGGKTQTDRDRERGKEKDGPKGETDEELGKKYGDVCFLFVTETSSQKKLNMHFFVATLFLSALFVYRCCCCFMCFISIILVCVLALLLFTLASFGYEGVIWKYFF